MPCHNEGTHIRETIGQLARQRWPEFEIIAVNDGSTDDTGAQLDALAGEVSQLRVIHFASNQGKAMAWLAGLRTAWVELSAEAYANQASDLLSILGYALACAVVFASWAYYNQVRFAHRTRRRQSPAAVTLVEEALALDVEPREAQAMRNQQHSTLVFDKNARPVVRRSADREAEPA